MRIFNTLTRSKEEFVPLNPGKVKMYLQYITSSMLEMQGHSLYLIR